MKSHDPSRDPEQDLVSMTLHQSEGLLFHHHYQVRFQVNVRITLIWVKMGGVQNKLRKPSKNGEQSFQITSLKNIQTKNIKE